jgi:hypothetical protein
MDSDYSLTLMKKATGSSETEGHIYRTTQLTHQDSNTQSLPWKPKILQEWMHVFQCNAEIYDIASLLLYTSHHPRQIL